MVADAAAMFWCCHPACALPHRTASDQAFSPAQRQAPAMARGEPVDPLKDWVYGVLTEQPFRGKIKEKYIKGGRMANTLLDGLTVIGGR